MVLEKEVKHYYFTVVVITKRTSAEFLDQDHKSTIALSTVDKDTFLIASSREKSVEVCIVLFPPEDCFCARDCRGCGRWDYRGEAKGSGDV